MGQEHFKQMYEDALAVDCRAMLLLMDMLQTPQYERVLYGSGFWESLPVDVIMAKARALVPVGDAFLLSMKTLLVEGTASVMVMDQHGNLFRVRDPDVIDFDDPVLPPEAFYHFMMTLDPELCSGDQNYG